MPMDDHTDKAKTENERAGEGQPLAPPQWYDPPELHMPLHLSALGAGGAVRRHGRLPVLDDARDGPPAADRAADGRSSRRRSGRSSAGRAGGGPRGARRRSARCRARSASSRPASKAERAAVVSRANAATADRAGEAATARPRVTSAAFLGGATLPRSRTRPLSGHERRSRSRLVAMVRVSCGNAEAAIGRAERQGTPRVGVTERLAVAQEAASVTRHEWRLGAGLRRVHEQPDA